MKMIILANGKAKEKQNQYHNPLSISLVVPKIDCQWWLIMCDDIGPDWLIDWSSVIISNLMIDTIDFCENFFSHFLPEFCFLLWIDIKKQTN